MTPWWQNRMCCFDLETTSPEPEEARIVTATVALVGGGLATDYFTVMVNPGVPIPDEAAAIHGITTERAVAEGLDPAVALPGVLAALRTAVEAGYALVAFNARYDFTTADREFRRHGIADLTPDLGLWAEMKVVDPFVCDKHLDRYRSGSRKLEETCRTLGVVLEGAHDASFDAVAAGRLAYVLGKRGRVVRRSPRSYEEGLEVRELHEEWARIRDDLPALHEAQRQWAYYEAIRLERYFHDGDPKKGVPPQPDRVVPREWPIVPFGWERKSEPDGIGPSDYEAAYG
jgi:DNA polymerase-3 subunit epsilon